MHQEFYTIQQLLRYAQEIPGKLGKGIYVIGVISEKLAHKIAQVSDLQVSDFCLTIDHSAIIHVLHEHGQPIETSRGQLPIKQIDIEQMVEWLPDVLTVRAGQHKPGRQPRVEMEQATATGTTIVIVEWRPSRKQLALITMYKKRPVT